MDNRKGGLEMEPWKVYTFIILAITFVFVAIVIGVNYINQNKED